MALQKEAKVEVSLDLDRAKAQIDGLKKQEADIDAIAKKSDELHKKELEERQRVVAERREKFRRAVSNIPQKFASGIRAGVGFARGAQAEDVIALGAALPFYVSQFIPGAPKVAPVIQQATRTAVPIVEEFGPAGVQVAKKILGDNPALNEVIEKTVKPLIENMSDQISKLRSELDGFRSAARRTSKMVSTQILLGGSPSVETTEQLFFDLHAVERTKSQVELTQKKLQRKIFSQNGAEIALDTLGKILTGGGLGR